MVMRITSPDLLKMRAKLEKLSKTILDDDMKKAPRFSARLMQLRAKRYAPRKSGRLMENIQKKKVGREWTVWSSRYGGNSKSGGRFPVHAWVDGRTNMVGTRGRVLYRDTSYTAARVNPGYFTAALNETAKRFPKIILNNNRKALAVKIS